MRFFNQSQSLTISNQITFNFHLKIVLESKSRVFVNRNICVAYTANQTELIVSCKFEKAEVTGVAQCFCLNAHTVTKNSTDI